MSAREQIDKLANFIMAEVEGEPSESEGAGDTAIRIIRALQEKVESRQDDVNLWQCMKEAGIDNVEVYSHGYDIYYERYPEKDEFA